MLKTVLLFILLFLVPRLAFGAVAHDSSGTGNTGSGVSTLSYTHTVTGSNTLIICSVSYAPGGTHESVSNITYNSVGLTQKASQTTDIQAAKVEMWYLFGAATGAHTAQVNFTGNVDSGAFDCTSFTGALSLGTATTINDVGTGLSCTVPASGLCYDVAFNIDGFAGCATRTPGGSATKRYDICEDLGAEASVEHFSSTISATATMNWDRDSGAWEGQIAVPINPSTTGTVRHKPIVMQ